MARETPHPPHPSRLAAVSRRRMLLRSSAVAGALTVLPGLACGSDDAAVFETSSGDAGTTTSTAASTSAATELAEEATSTTIVAADSSTSAVPSPATDGAVFPTGAELAVSFTFEPTSSGGRGPARNPYIAVWVEDAEGNLVDTVSVWYQAGKGDKWLPDLRSWYAVSDGGSDATMAGATRVAGSYTVAWDGTDLDGEAVAQGQYVLYVEAAREHGPYEITSTPLAIGSEAFSATLDDQGELSNLSAELIL